MFIDEKIAGIILDVMETINPVPEAEIETIGYDTNEGVSVSVVYRLPDNSVDVIGDLKKFEHLKDVLLEGNKALHSKKWSFCPADGMARFVLEIEE